MMMISKKIVMLSKGMYEISLVNGFVKNSLKGIRNITNGTLTLGKNFNTMKELNIHSIEGEIDNNNNTTSNKEESLKDYNNSQEENVLLANNYESTISERNKTNNPNLFNLLNLHKQTKHLLQQLEQETHINITNPHHFNGTQQEEEQTHNKEEEQHTIKNKRLLLLLFDEEEYLKRMVEVKYYYSDIVSVASELIELFINCDNDNIISSSTITSETITSTRVTSSTHLHFLLYVYHLYPRECKDLKERITILLEQFIDNNSNENIIINQNKITIKSNMEFLFYLRKFIENEEYHQLNEHITSVNVKYVKWLREMYGKEKNLMLEELEEDKGINNSNNNINNGNKEMISRLELLHDYLLVFPNMWNTNASIFSTTTRQSNNKQNTKKNNKHNRTISLTTTTITIPPKEIMETFDYFTEEYSHYTNQVIKHYLENITLINNKNNNNTNNESIQHNHEQQHLNNTTSYKHLLENELISKRTSSSFRQCFNLIKLLTHRLLVIFNLPINNTKGVKQEQKESKEKETETEQQQNVDQELELLSKKYCDNKINLLKYLPVNKMGSEEELIAVLMLVKQLLASYHIVRDIRHEHITNYLLELLKNNEHLIISNKDNNNINSQQLKREIKYAVNKLVSKLASCSWVDKDDELNHYLSLFEFSETNKYTSLNEKMINKDSWYEVNSE